MTQTIFLACLRDCDRELMVVIVYYMYKIHRFIKTNKNQLNRFNKNRSKSIIFIKKKKNNHHYSCNNFAQSQNPDEVLIKPKHFNVDFTVINKFITSRLLCFSIFIILSDMFPLFTSIYIYTRVQSQVESYQRLKYVTWCCLA